MFGDNNLINSYKRKIDYKNRISIPKEYNATNNESLFFINYGDEIRLYSLEETEKIIELIYNYLKNNYSYVEHKHLKRELCSRVIYEVIVHSNKITIPKDLINKYSIDNEIILEGKNKYVELKKVFR